MPSGKVSASSMVPVAGGWAGPDDRHVAEVSSNAARATFTMREPTVESMVAPFEKRGVRANAAHHYHPDRARFREFTPFWEFVAGPLHAGTFLPTPLDGTFGPEVRFVSVPKDMKPNRPPSEGLQFFGRGSIAEGSETLTVSLHDREGRSLYSVDLAPAR